MTFAAIGKMGIPEMRKRGYPVGVAAGLFLPPVAVILMAAPILLPIIDAAGFDSIWFAVVLTINMEIGLIHLLWV